MPLAVATPAHCACPQAFGWAIYATATLCHTVSFFNVNVCPPSHAGLAQRLPTALPPPRIVVQDHSHVAGSFSVLGLLGFSSMVRATHRTPTAPLTPGAGGCLKRAMGAQNGCLRVTATHTGTC